MPQAGEGVEAVGRQCKGVEASAVSLFSLRINKNVYLLLLLPSFCPCFIMMPRSYTLFMSDYTLSIAFNEFYVKS